MTSFLIMVKKEYLQFFRDLVILAFMIYLFIPDVIIAGKGLGISLKNARFALWDMSKTRESRELISKMIKPYFIFDKLLDDWGDLNKWMDNGDTAGAVVIPSDFERNIVRKKTASVLVALDGSLIATTMLSAAYMQSIISDYNLWVLRHKYHLPRFFSYPEVDARIRIEFNPNLESQYFGGLSELFTNVTMMAIILSALSFVRERDYGTIEQILVSPISFGKFALAKILFIASSLLFFVFVSLLIAIKGALAVPVRGSIFLFMVLSLINILADTGIGLVIAGLSNRISQVGLLTILFLAPMLFLSGGWVPPESMPNWLLPLTNLSPLKYYLELGLSIILKGATLKDVWFEFIKCSTISAVMLVLGYLILKRRLLEVG